MGAKVYLREKYAKVCNAKSCGGSGYGYSPTGVKGRYYLTPSDDKCEVIADLFNSYGKCVTVATTVFENSLGGKVIIFGATLGAKYTLSYREQKLVQHLMLECDDDVAFAMNEPNLYVIMNEAKDPEKSEFMGMLTVSNLCEDDLSRFFLHIPKKWLGFSEILSLGKDGEWTAVKYELDGQTLTVNEELKYLNPMYLLFK